MKFKINRDHFVNGLSQVTNVVGTRASMPILGNVLIQAEGDTVSLTTTNLDLGIRARIKAEVSTTGSITLPVKKLATIVRALPSNDTTVELSGQNRVKITSGGSVFQIMGLAADQFPALPTFANQHDFTLAQGDLLGLLKKVAYAQSTDENRYILNGVFFNFAEEKLTLVATDGRRLATSAKSMTIGEDQAGNLILPAKTVAELQRLLGDAGEVKISFNDRQVSFVTQVTKNDTGLVDNIHLVSKVVEGNYPNYRQVIPKETVHRVDIERELFLECVRRAAIMTSDKSSSVKLIVGDNEIEITASSTEFGEAHEKMTVKYEGPSVQIAFNPQYLSDPLQALADDTVHFEFKDDMSPGVFKNKEDFLCVVMPQRLN
ncbi:MAG: DNA polymerase III subunit beta [Puniceicoccales bacterium]|jgi:DNA polymerase-3 subunit beta|nr:DNA polymerase III subunit beta [Puniceicoccales bacterium]